LLIWGEFIDTLRFTLTDLLSFRLLAECLYRTVASFVAHGGLHWWGGDRWFIVPYRVLPPLVNCMVYVTVLVQQLCVQLWLMKSNISNMKYFSLNY
jgi:hypothetical protein